jgi:hypothetical protein
VENRVLMVDMGHTHYDELANNAMRHILARYTARHSRNQTLMAFPFPYDDWLFEN